MLKKTPGPKVYVKGAFDRSALVFYKSPGAEVGGGAGVAVRGVDAQRSVDGERCEEKRGKKGVSFFSLEKPAEENKLDNISGTAGSK